MPNKNLVAVALVTIIAIVGGLVAIAMLATDNSDKISEYLMVLVTVVAMPIITVLLSVLSDHTKTVKKAAEVAQHAHETARDTNTVVKHLANGEMDAKIEKVVRRLLEEYFGPFGDSTKD